MKISPQTFIIAYGFLLLTACETKNTDPPKKDRVCISDTLQKMIHIDTVKTTNIDDELVLSGEIGFDENKVVKVFPFSSGQVLEVKVSLGDKVKQGQILAVIKSAEIVGNYSDLSTAERDESIARRQMDSKLLEIIGSRFRGAVGLRVRTAATTSSSLPSNGRAQRYRPARAP